MPSNRPVDWKVYRFSGGSYVEDSDIYDLSMTDAYNRFARQARLKFFDFSGTKPNNYPKGTRIKIDVKPEGSTESYFTRFGGFVVGYDSEEHFTLMDVYSHDFWLRQRAVFESFSGATLSGIVSGVVNEYTPLTYDTSKINIVNNISGVTREWRGERVDIVLNEISQMSAGEYYGANDSGVFFFKQRDTTHASKDFSGTSTFHNLKFEEMADRDLNRVRVYYGEWTESGVVTVENKQDQKDLQDVTGSPRPVIREDSFDHPEISNEDAARRKGRSYIEGTIGIKRGEMKTWESYDITPGEVTTVQSPDHDMSDGTDFRIASIEYEWLADETSIKLAEDKEGVIDVLVDLQPEVTRVDLKNIDSDLTPTRVNALEEDVDMDISLSLYKESVDLSGFKIGNIGAGVGINNPIGINIISGAYVLSGVSG